MAMSSDPKSRGIASIAHLFLSDMPSPAMNRRRPPVHDDAPEVSVPSSSDTPKAAAAAAPPVPQPSDETIELDPTEASFWNDLPDDSCPDADEMTLAVFVTPERNSVIDAYKTIKAMLQEAQAEPAVSIVVYEASSAQQGQAIFDRLSSACLNFLELVIESAGILTGGDASALVKTFIAEKAAGRNYYHCKPGQLADMLSAGPPAQAGCPSEPHVQPMPLPQARPQELVSSQSALTVHTPLAVSDYPADQASLQNLLLNNWPLWHDSLRDCLLVPLSQLTGQPCTPAWLACDPQGRLSLLEIALELASDEWQALLTRHQQAQQHVAAFAARMPHLKIDPAQTIGLMLITGEHAAVQQSWLHSIPQLPVRSLHVHYLSWPPLKALLVL